MNLKLSHNHRSPRILAAFAAAIFIDASAAGEWSVERSEPKPGTQSVAVLHSGAPVARFIYGPEQMKPYLHLYGADGEQLTNSGEDGGRFQHHRGFFVGWKVESELGTYDLWHMRGGGDLKVQNVADAIDAGSVTLTVNIDWLARRSDSSGSNVLLKETRTMRISQPAQGDVQVDLTVRMDPARTVRLAGDLQHSGVHFRAVPEVDERRRQTSYRYSPDRVKGGDLKWAQLLFPVGDTWYAATLMNAPSNPVEELSTRDYGRFGYFFKRELHPDEPLTLRYRLLVEEVKEDHHKNKDGSYDKAFEAFSQPAASEKSSK